LTASIDQLICIDVPIFICVIAIMDVHPAFERDLLLITGIPGTGKTTYGDKFAQEFGFLHRDLEDPQTLNRFFTNPSQFIDELLNEKKKTWWSRGALDRITSHQSPVCCNSEVLDSSGYGSTAIAPLR
jgi:hypothetical protein